MCRLLTMLSTVLCIVSGDAFAAATKNKSAAAKRDCNQVSVICRDSGNDRITIPAAEESRIVYSGSGNDTVDTYYANFLYVDTGPGNDKVNSTVGENGQAMIVTGSGDDLVSIKGRALIFTGPGKDKVAIGDHRGQFEQVFVDGGDTIKGFLTADSLPENGGDVVGAVKSWATDGRNKEIYDLRKLDSNDNYALDPGDEAVTEVPGGLKLVVPGVGMITVIGTPAAPVKRLPFINVATK
jgi:hypothetical protein